MREATAKAPNPDLGRIQEHGCHGNTSDIRDNLSPALRKGQMPPAPAASTTLGPGTMCSLLPLPIPVTQSRAMLSLLLIAAWPHQGWTTIRKKTKNLAINFLY